MTVYTATSQAQADTLIPKLVGGDTLLFVGSFGPWRPAGRKFDSPVLFDFSKATVKDIYTGGWGNVIWRKVTGKVGKVYSTCLRVENSTDCDYEDLNIDGTEDGAQGWAFAFWLNGGSARVTNPTIKGAANGIMFNNMDPVFLNRGALSQLRSDAIQYADCTIIIDGTVISGLTPAAGDHPDMIQGRTTKGKPPRDATIRNVQGEGNGQGVFIGSDDGISGPGVVTVENCNIKGGFVRAISVSNAAKSVVRGNDVSTLPGSQYQAIILCPDNDGTNIRSKNIVRAATLSNGSTAKEIRDPDYVPPAPAPTPTPTPPTTLEIWPEAGQTVIVHPAGTKRPA